MTERGWKLAGDLVREEAARQGFKMTAAADRARLSRSTFYKVLDGDATVQSISLRQVEGALGLPRHLLTAVIAEDTARVQNMAMDPDLRRSVMDALAPPPPEPRKRRRA